MKKIVRFVVELLALFALIGCATGNGEKSASSNKTPEKTPGGVEASAAPTDNRIINLAGTKWTYGFLINNQPAYLDIEFLPNGLISAPEAPHYEFFNFDTGVDEWEQKNNDISFSSNRRVFFYKATIDQKEYIRGTISKEGEHLADFGIWDLSTEQGFEDGLKGKQIKNISGTKWKFHWIDSIIDFDMEFLPNGRISAPEAEAHNIWFDVWRQNNNNIAFSQQFGSIIYKGTMVEQDEIILTSRRNNGETGKAILFQD